MSIERGDKLLVEEMTIAIGATATPAEVVAYLMDRGALHSDRIRGMIARERFRRIWTRRVGNMDIMEVCTAIATDLDVLPKTVHYHALTVMRGA